MSNLRIAGLCATVVLAVALYASSSALAGPSWVSCLEVAGTGSFEDSKCTKEMTGGKFEWEEPISPKTVEVKLSKFRLKDEKGGLFGEKVTVECSGSPEGSIGSSGKGEVAKVTVTGCTSIENCPGSITAMAINLPWTTELYETGGQVRTRILKSMGGAPGWKVTCSGLTDECVGETNAKMTNIAGSGTEAEFEGESPKGVCTIGGNGEGILQGAWTIVKEVGAGVAGAVKYCVEANITLAPSVTVSMAVGGEASVSIVNFSCRFREEVAEGKFVGNFEVLAPTGKCYTKNRVIFLESCSVTVKPTAGAKSGDSGEFIIKMKNGDVVKKELLVS